MEEKIWYIEIDGKQEGPYSVLNLKSDLRITPETLVWKEGFDKWVPIGQVPELDEVFKDEDVEETEEEEEIEVPPDGEITLQMREDPPSPFMRYLVILAIVLLSYLLIHFFLV